MLRILLLSLALFAVLPAGAAHGTIEYGPGEKLLRGAVNIALSPLAIPIGLWKAERRCGLWCGILIGPVEGCSGVPVRALAGLIDVGTFWVNWPASDNGPLVRPGKPWNLGDSK